MTNRHANWLFAVKLSWVSNDLASCPTRFQQFGMLRMVWDAFHVSGLLAFNVDDHIVQISLNQAHELTMAFIDALASFLACDGTVANLRQI